MTAMAFSIDVPPHRQGAKLPVVWYLSGLTCTHANVTEKGEFRRACAELGLIFVAPDTSPRGEGVPDGPDGAYDFGLGAGFYVDATQQPWAANYRMRSYIEAELPALIAEHFPADMIRQGIMGHSSGWTWRAYDRLAQPRSLSQRLRLRAHRRAAAGFLLQEGASALSRRRCDRLAPT